MIKTKHPQAIKSIDPLNGMRMNLFNKCRGNVLYVRVSSLALDSIIYITATKS